MLLVVSLSILACTGSSSKEEGEAGLPPALEGGWIEVVTRDPARFTAVVEPDREAWAALHRGEYTEALELAQGPWIRRRAWRALQAYDDAIIHLSGHVWPATLETWQAKSGLPEGTALPLLAGLVLADNGRPDEARAWFQRVDRSASAEVQELAAVLGNLELSPEEPWESKGLPAPAPGGAGALTRCLHAHASARQSGSFDGLATVRDACPEPLLEEPTAEARRALYDPLFHATRRRLKAPGELPPQGEPNPLAEALFSAAWSEEPGHRWQEPLGLGPPPPGDDPAWARERVQQLDRVLDAWTRRYRDGLSEEGLEILDGLQLLAVFRSRFLTRRAREALHADHPQQALVFAQAALDLSLPREVGPTNPPELFALTAEALLRTGRSREALDALQVLSEHDPRVRGLQETTGDLVILENLDRQGDSKER